MEREGRPTVADQPGTGPVRLSALLASPSKLDNAREEIELALLRISKLFNAGCKLTFLMRNPEAEDGDMVITDDDLGQVVKAVERLAEKEIAPGTRAG